MLPVSRGGTEVAMASSWQPIQGGVTAPNGFQAAGIVAGLKPSGADLAVLLAPRRPFVLAPSPPPWCGGLCGSLP